MAIGANALPQAVQGELSSSVHIGRDVSVGLPAATIAWAARIWFGANAESVLMDFESSTITPDTVGVRQVEVTAIVAAAGCTAAGNLPVVVTGAGIPGTPLTVNVPLTPAKHGTAELIAAAVAAKLAATPAINALWNITQGDGENNPPDNIVARRIYPEANDGTFNIAIPGSLGVSPDVSSTNPVAGEVGTMVDRLGANGFDVFGQGLPGPSEFLAVLYSMPAGVPNGVATSSYAPIRAGGLQCIYQPEATNFTELLTADGGKTYLDVVVLGK